MIKGIIMKKYKVIVLLILACFLLTGNSYAQYSPEKGYQISIINTTSTSTVIEYVVNDGGS